MALNPDSFIVGKRVSKPNSPEGAFLDYTEAGVMLVLRYPNITEEARRDVMRGVAQFRVGQIEGVIIFLARFGMLPWQNANFHRGKGSFKETLPLQGREGYPIHVLLVSSETGILRAKQKFPLGRKTAERFNILLEAQDKELPSNWDILVKRAYRKHTVNQIAALFGMES